MSTDDSDRNDDDGKEEPRAKDLFTRPRQQLEAEMDPETLAQLASWFDMPNLADAREQAELVEQETEEERQLAARAKKKADACAAADPRLLHYIARHERAQVAIAPAFDVKAVIDDSIVNIVVRKQLERQSADMPVSDVLEFEQPPDVGNIVRDHNAPQALLRDLFRPVEEYAASYQSPFDELPDMDPARHAREAIRERLKVVWPESTFSMAQTARATQRALLRGSWPGYLEEIQKKKERDAR